MPRKPIHLEMIDGKGLRQRVWDRIRDLKGASFVLRDIARGKESIETVRDYLVGLGRAGFLEVIEAPNSLGRGYPIKHYRLVRDNGIDAPRVRRDGSAVTQGLAQEQMWRTLRMHKGDINARELAAHASTEAIPVAEVAAKDYLRQLHGASYLACIAEGKGIGSGGIQARFRLISNTGPKPPMVCRTDSLFDPNLNAIVWVKPVNEEDAIYAR